MRQLSSSSSLLRRLSLSRLLFRPSPRFSSGGGLADSPSASFSFSRSFSSPPPLFLGRAPERLLDRSLEPASRLRRSRPDDDGAAAAEAAASASTAAAASASAS
eukprot:CAMPEP_0177401268 /NCGR_PEP_ID=MMETSP0368-20130122/59553_1 /TAXON_ID=447022 ORGANISM="Scrippsiella hangoei-like, Strain SHHI-4" /NCGR_SAMPLE_ID=MMETSP0368 /ASSEMBLY_ACC=CAM_ASM_000363 /LENGTH=103 /DNA_ID=CAMNT_0018868825 /DNA_START=33 /DNA_END=341 /DNA_ORIENTATION=-